MIKSVFVITLILFASASFAQTTTPVTTVSTSPTVQFGLKTGLNIANVKSDLYDNSKSTEALYAGLLAHIHLNNNFAIQPEILYSNQGFKYKLSTNLNVTSDLDYINIPILVQYMYRGFRLETGPQIGFIVDAKYKYSDGRKDDVEDRFNKTDFSWGFGLGYISPIGLGAGARYNLGIRNINKDITRVNVTNPDINNRVWQFGLFYQFVR